MKKFLFAICFFMFFANASFAENDFNKLSKEDQEQCKEMKELYYDLYDEKDIKKLKKYNVLSFRLNTKKLVEVDYGGGNFFLEPFLVESEHEVALIFRNSVLMGITPIIIKTHHPVLNKHDYDEYNQGYFIKYDYYHKDNKEALKWGGNRIVVFVKELPKESISYIKVRNCFVEKFKIVND